MTDLPLALDDVLAPLAESCPESPTSDARAEPTFDEAHEEWLRFYEIPLADIDPTGEHVGQYVAAYEGTVRDYDSDPVVLRRRVAQSLGVHPERLVVSYLDS